MGFVFSGVDGVPCDFSVLVLCAAHAAAALAA